MSAILDGHHRTMAALLEHKKINCISISRVNDVTIWGKEHKQKFFWAFGEAVDLSILPPHIGKKVRHIITRSKNIDTSIVQKYLIMNSEGWGDISFNKEVIESAKLFPQVNDMISIYMAGELDDEKIQDSLLGNEFNEEDVDNLRDVFKALIALNDSRAYEVGFKIALSYKWNTLWEEAYKYLARFKNKDVEDLFIDFFINDQEKRAHIRKIIDDYFREDVSDKAN
jgi:hypothetical protein